MKKYLYPFMVALMALSSFALVSCSDDSDDDGTVSASIVGTWKYEFLDSDELNDYFDEQYIQFKVDGTMIEVYISRFLVSETEVEISKTRWSCSGNTLTIYGNEDYVTSTSEIIKLTDTYLMLSTLGIPTSYKRVPDSEIEKYLE